MGKDEEAWAWKLLGVSVNVKVVQPVVDRNMFVRND
jgi:hypothetical protein